MKFERVGDRLETVEWIGAMGERVEVCNWTKKDLGGTGRDRGVIGRQGRDLEGH